MECIIDEKTIMKYKRIPYNIGEVEIPRGKVHVMEERCKGCGFCVQYCPEEVLELSTEYNTKGYHPPIVKNSDSCVNCGLCEMICPDFAIWSTFKAMIKLRDVKTEGND
jgi:2-oxoglutarate ferredoxin oxidoreductase subunit delta